MTDIRRGIPVEALWKRFQGAEVVAFCCLLTEVKILHGLQMFAFASCTSIQTQYNTINFKEPRTVTKYEFKKFIYSVNPCKQLTYKTKLEFSMSCRSGSPGPWIKRAVARLRAPDKSHVYLHLIHTDQSKNYSVLRPKSLEQSRLSGWIDCELTRKCWQIVWRESSTAITVWDFFHFSKMTF